MNVDLVGFSVPNFVRMKMPIRPRQEGFNPEPPSFSLKEIDADTLSSLCDNFRREVFNKAGKIDPMQCETEKP